MKTTPLILLALTLSLLCGCKALGLRWTTPATLNEDAYNPYLGKSEQRVRDAMGMPDYEVWDGDSRVLHYGHSPGVISTGGGYNAYGQPSYAVTTVVNHHTRFWVRDGIVWQWEKK